MSIATLPGFSQRATARRRPPIDHEIVVDGFAGAGGWGLGEEIANGWAVDVAFNHDPLALETYGVNHPGTRLYCADAFEVDPRTVEPGRRIAHCHFSPDCTHHSKARGGAPVSDRVRGLAWIVLSWGHHRRPRVITLENVEEFQDWGPTIDVNGRCVPDPIYRGETFDAFIGALTVGVPARHPAIAEIRATLGPSFPIGALLNGLGYQVEHRELRACDYGAPTIRKRFFMVARSDGQRIRWPKPTHGPRDSADVIAGRLKPYRTAAQCIDWSLPCPSIFMSKAEADAYYRATGQRVVRPLRDNTLKRIANGVMRFAVNSAEPYIVSVNHGDSGGSREYSVNEPMRTICAARRGEAVVSPYLIPRYGERDGQSPRCRSIDEPMPTIVPSGNGAALVAPVIVGPGGQDFEPRDGGQPLNTILTKANQAIVAPLLVGAGGTTGTGRPRAADRPLKTIKTEDRQSLVSAFIARHFGGMNARDLNLPTPTLTARATQNQVAAAHLMKLRGTCQDGQGIGEPMPTLTAGGNHAALIYSFLVNYYSSGSGKTGRKIDAPLPTITCNDRMGLVTVMIGGEPYIIADIGMRMLQPHELLRAQFREYADGWVLLGTKTQQTAGIGNSVCPHVARAIVKANVRIQRVKDHEAA